MSGRTQPNSDEFEILRQAARLFEDASNVWMERALKAESRIQELEAELASCRACRDKIDCLSRGAVAPQADWNFSGDGPLGPSCKD